MRMASRLSRKGQCFVRIIKWLFYLYITIAALVGTGYLALCGGVAYMRYARIVELPNGMRLTQSFLHGVDRNGFVLRNQDNTFVLAAKDAEIAWQADYVFGMASKVTSDNQEGDAFIYKRGWEKPIIYNSDVDAQHRDELAKYGLRGFIDYDPKTLFQGSEYEECLERNGMRECRFRVLEQYRQDVEDGKKQPYQCKNKKLPEKCYSYSTYKTYLSLVSREKHHRNWSE